MRLVPVMLLLAMTITVLPNSPSWSWGGGKEGWGQGPCKPGVLIPDETKEKGYYCLLPEPERKKGFNRSQCLKDCRAGCAQKYHVAADLKRCSAGCSSGCAQ